MIIPQFNYTITIKINYADTNYTDIKKYNYIN